MVAPRRGVDAVGMTDEKPTPIETPAATTTTPTVVTVEREKSSWARPVAAVAVLVATLLVGGIGGFVVAHAVEGPRAPIGALMDRPDQDDRGDLRPGQGDQQGPGQQGPGQRPPQHDGPGPRPGQQPPAENDTTDDSGDEETESTQ